MSSINLRDYYVMRGTTSIEGILPLIKSIIKDDVNVIMYEDHGVSIGLYRNQEFIFESERPITKFLQELRLFNEKCELKFIRTSENQYIYRFISDDKIPEAEVVQYDTVKENPKYLLYGTRVEKYTENKGVTFTHLTEASGVKVTLPYKLDEVNDDLQIEVINYISYSDDGIMYFVDNRLTNFYYKDKVLLRSEGR